MSLSGGRAPRVWVQLSRPKRVADRAGGAGPMQARPDLPPRRKTLEVHTLSKLAKLTPVNSLSFPLFPVRSCAVEEKDIVLSLPRL